MYMGEVALTTGATLTTFGCENGPAAADIWQELQCDHPDDDIVAYYVAGMSDWMELDNFQWTPIGGTSEVMGGTVDVWGHGVMSERTLSSKIVFPDSACRWDGEPSWGLPGSRMVCTGGTAQPGDYIGPPTLTTWSADSDSWRDAPLGKSATHVVSSSCEDSRGCSEGQITWSADGIRIVEAEPSDDGTYCYVEDGTAFCQVWGFRAGYTSKVTLTYEKTSSASQEVTMNADCRFASGSACGPATVNAPGLSVEVIGPRDVGMGVDVDYAVYVTNDSSEPVPGVNVTMSSNDGMVEVVNASGGDGWACDSATMECTAASLAPGAASAVGFIVKVNKDWCIKQGAIQAVGSATVKGAEPVIGSVDLKPWPCPGEIVVEPGTTTAETAVGGVMIFDVDDPGNWSISSSDPDVMSVSYGGSSLPRGEALTAGTTKVALTNSFTGEKWTIQVTVTP